MWPQLAKSDCGKLYKTDALISAINKLQGKKENEGVGKLHYDI